MLNEKTRAWTNTPDGKEYQRRIFQWMFEHRMEQMKYGDGKFDWMSRGYVEAKLKKTWPDMDHKKFIWAVQRLEEHGLIKSQYFGRGEDLRIMKRGWDRWEKSMAS